MLIIPKCLLHAKFYPIVHNNWDVAAWIPNIVHVNSDEETEAEVDNFPKGSERTD